MSETISVEGQKMSKHLKHEPPKAKPQPKIRTSHKNASKSKAKTTDASVPTPDQSDLDDKERIRKQNLEKRVRRRVALEEKAFRIVEVLIDNPITDEYLLNCLQFLEPCHYDDVVEERSLGWLCGYPICPNTLSQMAKQKYRISTKTNTVYDISERKKYCSNHCFKASQFLLKQVPPTAVWIRETEAPPKFQLLHSKHSGSAGEAVISHSGSVTEEDNLDEGLQNKKYTSSSTSPVKIPPMHEPLSANTSLCDHKDSSVNSMPLHVLRQTYKVQKSSGSTDQAHDSGVSLLENLSHQTAKMTLNSEQQSKEQTESVSSLPLQPSIECGSLQSVKTCDDLTSNAYSDIGQTIPDIPQENTASLGGELKKQEVCTPTLQNAKDLDLELKIELGKVTDSQASDKFVKSPKINSGQSDGADIQADILTARISHRKEALDGHTYETLSPQGKTYGDVPFVTAENKLRVLEELLDKRVALQDQLQVAKAENNVTVEKTTQSSHLGVRQNKTFLTEVAENTDDMETQCCTNVNVMPSNQSHLHCVVDDPKDDERREQNSQPSTQASTIDVSLNKDRQSSILHNILKVQQQQKETMDEDDDDDVPAFPSKATTYPEKVIEKTPKKKPKKHLAKKVTLIQLLTQTWMHWKTKETVMFLSGQGKKVEETSGNNRGDFEMKYAALGRRVARREYEMSKLIGEELKGGEDGFSENRQNFEKLPNIDSLRMQSDQFDVKESSAKEKGASKYAATGEILEKVADENPEIILPFVDSHSVIAHRRKIVLDQINRGLPDLLRVLKLSITDVSAPIRKLLHTLNLTSTNILLKPVHWTIISLVILKLLAVSMPNVKSALEDELPKHYFRSFLLSLDINESEIEHIIRIVIC